MELRRRSSGAVKELFRSPEGDLLRRLGIVAAAVFLFTAAFSTLHSTYAQKFYDVTGHAQWIWASHRMSDDVPVAFYAARDFDLPDKRYFTHLKVLGDPEYTVYLNGAEIAARHVGEERTLDLYDVSQLVKTGRNRIVIAVRAPRGVGGLLASIDIAPEVANWVVTDGSWKIYRKWTPRLLQRDLPIAARPIVVGEPPIGRWNYLTVVRQELEQPVKEVLQPIGVFEQMGRVPKIETRSGVAVAGVETQRATAFDFGPASHGRVRLTIVPNRASSQLVNVRFANELEELGQTDWGLRPLILAPGESVITTPEPHAFRYVMVFNKREVRAEVVR
jgi:hypothetical protein